MNEFKVGLLALASIVGVVFMSLKITSNQSGFGEYVNYSTIVADAAGIFEKSPIKVAGISAGRIKTIELAGTQALIEFEILQNVPITQGSILKIKSVGFLGDKYLEISLGESKDRLPEGSLIPSYQGGGLEDITKDASEVLNDVKAIVKSIKSSLAPEGEESPVKAIVSNIEKITADIRATTTTLKRVIGDNEDKLNAIVENLDITTDRLAYHLNQANEDSLMKDLKTIGPVLNNARDLTADLKEVIADVKAGKGTVGKLLRDEQVIDQVETTLSGVNRLFNRVNSIQTELSFFTGADTEKAGRSDVNINIWPSPERFYKLGLASSEIGLAREMDIMTTDGSGNESFQNRRETDRNTFRFNLQLGRKIHNWSFRVGAIESTGGIGVDYDWISWGTRFTFEVFDYDEDLGPNIRLFSEFRMWNVLYGKLGFEDLVSKRDEQSVSFAAGLRFSDEDLRSLIGFFF